MTLRDEVDKAVADKTPEDLVEILEFLHLPILTRANETDEQYKKRLLDHNLFHKIESKRKRAIELICGALGVESFEERSAEAAERSARLAEESGRNARWAMIAALVSAIVAVLALIISLAGLTLEDIIAWWNG